MGIIKVNNGVEYYISETHMTSLHRWLALNAAVSPMHFLGKLDRPMCSALSNTGTKTETDVTCQSCQEALSHPAVRGRLEREKHNKSLGIAPTSGRVSARRGRA